MCVNNKKIRKVKNNTLSMKRRDNLEIHGNLLYMESGKYAIATEEVYKNPSVPGEYAGDC